MDDPKSCPSSFLFLSCTEFFDYGTSPYAFCNSNPVNYVDPDGRDGVYINFPEYRISILGRKIPNLGHAGVLLIDNSTGLTKYYEYGRYDEQNKGIVRNHKIPNVVIDANGRPTDESLDHVLKAISRIAGHNGPIKGVYVESEHFGAMNEYAQSRMRENANDDRVVYNDLNNNCSTFAEDVLRQDPEVNEQVRSRFINIPNRVVDILEKLFEPIFYDDKKVIE